MSEVIRCPKSPHYTIIEIVTLLLFCPLDALFTDDLKNDFISSSIL